MTTAVKPEEPETAAAASLRERATLALVKREAAHKADQAARLSEQRDHMAEFLAREIKQVLDAAIPRSAIELVDDVGDPWNPRCTAYVTLDGVRFCISHRDLSPGRSRVYVVRICGRCQREVWDAVVEGGGLADLALVLATAPQHGTYEACGLEPPPRATPPRPVDVLQAKRREIATLDRRLAELDRERLLKRVALTLDFYGQMNPATKRHFTQDQAEDAARVHPDYTPLLKQIEEVRQDRDNLLAEAEALRLQIELDIAEIHAAGRDA